MLTEVTNKELGLVRNTDSARTMEISAQMVGVVQKDEEAGLRQQMVEVVQRDAEAGLR